MQSKRPPRNERKFVSEALEQVIAQIGPSINDGHLRELFENCLPNALDTAVEYASADGSDTFVVTGDIPAMWLRDASCQVWPYLRLVGQDEPLRLLVAGLVRRQARMVLLDPYANAFNRDENGPRHGEEFTEVKPGVWERKWELDSLCHVVRLAHGYWRASGDANVFDDTWVKAAKLIVATMKEQQRFDSPGPYRFAHPEIARDGLGAETKPNGMVHSLFRPSDDATRYPFLVPANLFAVKALRLLAEIHNDIFHDEPFVVACRDLAGQIEQAVMQYGVTEHPEFGLIFAYEVDGLGGSDLMDDANIPSLLSLSYLDPDMQMNEIYLATRRFALSQYNPYFHVGTTLSGIGSSHTAEGTVWPISIMMQALTSHDGQEVIQCLKWLVHSDAGTGFMHESVNPDDPQQFTRPWFSWANSLLGELVWRLHDENPGLL